MAQQPPQIWNQIWSKPQIKSYTLHPKPSTLDPQLSTLNPQPSTLNPQPYALHLQPQSLIQDDTGSVGELSRIGVEGFDRVDNVLLELTLAISLREEPASAVQVPAFDPRERQSERAVRGERRCVDANMTAGHSAGAARPSAARGGGGGLRSISFLQAGGSFGRAEQGDQQAGRGDTSAAGAERGQGYP